MKKIIAAIVSFFMLCSIAKAQTPSVVVYTDSPAVAPSLLMQGTKDNPIYKFMLKVAAAPAIITAVKFTTSNTAAADIGNYRLFWGTTNSLKDSKAIARIADSLGTGAHTFDLTKMPLVLPVSGTPYYFFITADVTDSGISSVANSLLVPAAIKGADLSFYAPQPVIKDSSFPGGNQTIVLNTSPAAPASPKDTSARDVVTNQLMFLNAFNFDFSGQLASNYVGHVNIYSPEPIKHGWWKHLGFNVGIMKLNYSNNDTVQAQQVRENVLMDPLQKPVIGSRYLEQLNIYTTQIKQSAWSFYAQPLIQLTSLNSPQKVFIHGHFELLVNKYTTTTTVSNVKTDTAVVDSSAAGAVFRSGINNQTSFNNNFLDGYFGAGFTFDLQPYKSAEFFFQPTIGWTTGIPTLSPLKPQDLNNRVISVTKKWYMFYLVRAYYIQKLSGVSTLVLGTDMRGFLPKDAPHLATYIGVNINVDNVIKLLGINSQSNQ